MDIFDELRKHGKKPVIAHIGGFRPLESIKSWFGGNFLGNEDFVWPKYKGTEMMPVMQICVSEVSGGRDFFGDNELVQVFLVDGCLPFVEPSKNGIGWLLVEHKSLQNLVPVDTPKECRKFKPFQVKWSISDEDDYPCWDESGDFADMTQVSENEELFDSFFEEFGSYTNTKIGGYASYIQSPCGEGHEYVLQISSEKKPGFMIGDNGNLYIFKSKDDGQWYLNWDCY